MPYTSGTTGNPKGCVHINRSTMTTAVASTLWLGFTAATVQLVTLPLFHVTGMHICMIGGLMRGGTLHLMTRWNRDLAIDLIERNRATTWIAISAMVIDVVNADGLDRRDLSSLAMIMGGGAAMPEAVAARLHDLTGLDYIEGYGLSETSAPVMINPPLAPRRGCLGIPLMDVDARIIDVDTLHELPAGETGEIVVSAPQVFQGYWQRPEASADAFIDLDGVAFLRSGDLGYRDKDGYFYMVDRLKRMINAAGYKVWPTEVESILFRHPGISEVCIIAVPDDRRGETVRAVVVRRPGHDNLDEAAIIAWCRDRMAAYKLPRSVAFVDELQKSATGKVMWRLIQDREWA
jgi:fatty-acyl-CoA synthase